MNMKLKCPLCGSHRIQTVGGENGDPFNRTPEKTVCLDCGMTLNRQTGLGDLLKSCADLATNRCTQKGGDYETGNRFKN